MGMLGNYTPRYVEIAKKQSAKLLFSSASTAGSAAALGAPSGGAVTANAVTKGVSLVFRTLPQSKIIDFRQPPQRGRMPSPLGKVARRKP